MAGVFTTYLNNPNGCDTVVHTTVTLLLPDTTHILTSTCNISSAGTITQFLLNQMGCDSLVITSTQYVPPADTTSLFQQTCDSSALGVFQQILSNQSGCDSLIITSVTSFPSDTTRLTSTSCDSMNIGVFQNLLSNNLGCDSLVITTVTAGAPDTTLLFFTSCDSSSLGVFENHFTLPNQCDSLVITTVSFSARDSTFITDSSCNPGDVGVFISSYTNQFGCDSIVTMTVSLLPTSDTFISGTTCDSLLEGNFIHAYINQFGCDSIVHETIKLLSSSETFLFSTTCNSSQAGVFTTLLQNQNGCDSIVTLTVTLTGGDTTNLNYKTCDPNAVGATSNTYINQAGCDSLVISQTSLFPVPSVDIQVTSDFNGYAISCFGESDGSVTANGMGINPFQYLWSGGGTDQNLTGLSAGIYEVTMTDGNGCIAQDAITLVEPEEFSIGFEITEPDCFDQQQGSITVQQSGGVVPIRYSIDGINFQPSPVFSDLSSGTYTITALDGNDCEDKEIIWINVPLAVNVDLGVDRIILPGDTTVIEAIVNIPFDSLTQVTWSGLTNPNCANCLLQPVAPIISSTYSVSVTSVSGCSDQDSMIVFVKRNIDIYIPNIFPPMATTSMTAY